MKNSLSSRESIVLVLVALATLAGGCVVDASPEPTLSATGSSTAEVDRTQQAAPGAPVLVNAPSAAAPLAPGVQNAMGQSAVELPTPPTPALPRVITFVEIDETQGPVEDGPRPHPWVPAPEDPTGKPSIGGSDQSTGNSSGK